MNESMRCRGMKDILPAEMERFRRVEEAFRRVCLGWGYQEVRTPTIEHLHLFTAAGTLSPQMLGRVYSFLDWDGWSGERVVLRPDSTIPAARLYVESLRDRKVAKLFYVQNVFRFAEGDESREDWQCGVELIGDTQPSGDLELIMLGCEVLEALEIEPELYLSDPGILRAVLEKAGFQPAEQLALYDRILGGELEALDEVQERLPASGGSVRALLASVGEGVAFVNNLGSALLPAVPELARPLEELTALSEALTQVGRGPRIAPALVRNFEYYTGPVFQFHAGGRKLGGGGRYDALLSLVGDVGAPASGFALEVDALSGLARVPSADGPSRVAVRPARDEAADLAAAFRLAVALRGEGLVVEVSGADEGLARWRVVAGRDGFLLSGDGLGERRLAAAEDVLRALAEGRRD